MSRNNDRLQTPASDISPPPVATNLKFVSPVETVSLPSQGLYYSDSHPLHGKESVEIKHLTAVEEDILSNKTYIKKGIVIDKMLQSILTDKTISLDSLLIGDKNALIIASRITGFGAEYDANVTCPSCGGSSRHSFDLSQLASTCGDPSRVTANGTILINLPVSKCDVECRFITGEEEKYIVANAEMKSKHNLAETPITDFLRIIIISVNGDSDKDNINKIITSLPMKDSRLLRREYEKSVPNVDMHQSFACSLCGTESEVEVPLGPNFFWSR